MKKFPFMRGKHPPEPGQSREILFSETGAPVQIPAWADALAHQFASEMMDAAELTFLLAALFQLKCAPGDFIVEIGTYHGNTSVLLGKALQEMKYSMPVVAIDPFERVQPRQWNPAGSLAQYLNNLRAHRLEAICFPIVAFSHQAAQILGNQIALLIVDGDHEYTSVQQDLALFAPKVRAGGLIFADDYVPAYPGVMRAIDEFLAVNSNWRLIHRAWFVILEKASVV